MCPMSPVTVMMGVAAGVVNPTFLNICTGESQYAPQPQQKTHVPGPRLPNPYHFIPLSPLH